VRAARGVDGREPPWRTGRRFPPWRPARSTLEHPFGPFADARARRLPAERAGNLTRSSRRRRVSQCFRHTNSSRVLRSATLPRFRMAGPWSWRLCLTGLKVRLIIQWSSGSFGLVRGSAASAAQATSSVASPLNGHGHLSSEAGHPRVICVTTKQSYNRGGSAGAVRIRGSRRSCVFWEPVASCASCCRCRSMINGRPSPTGLLCRSQRGRQQGQPPPCRRSDVAAAGVPASRRLPCARHRRR
jgi:hypothetical protein